MPPVAAQEYAVRAEYDPEERFVAANGQTGHHRFDTWPFGPSAVMHPRVPGRQHRSEGTDA